MFPYLNFRQVIHYQFESIHPFYDGNGRTGRIINILYLILKDLLDIPILYLSRYIINNKSDYYRLLREVSANDSIEDWILYMLDGVEQTSLETIELVEIMDIPSNDKLFAGANLIVTNDLNRKGHGNDVIVFSEHANEISWLIFQLQEIYSNKIDYLNKYTLYPSLGKEANKLIQKKHTLQEILIGILDKAKLMND